jgi:hypothetical protein
VFIDQLERTAVSLQKHQTTAQQAYLSELLSLLFPLCAILIFLDGAKEEVDLRDDDFGE